MTLVSAPSETLRGRLEAIVDLTVRPNAPAECSCAGCCINEHAVAALAILDKAERGRHRGAIADYKDFAVIPDPEVLPPPPAKTPQEETA